jgi:hypothetical protein
MILNFIPVGHGRFEGFMIELCPSHPGCTPTGWRWAIRLENCIMKGISRDYHEERDAAYREALDWWDRNHETYWEGRMGF